MLECKRSATLTAVRVQELCESGSGRAGLLSLTSLMVSVDVKQHFSNNDGSESPESETRTTAKRSSSFTV